MIPEPDSQQARQDAALREAAGWLERLRVAEPSTADIAQWRRWLRNSASNSVAFERVQSVWEVAGDLRRPHWPSAAEFERDRYDGGVPISQWVEGAAGVTADGSGGLRAGWPYGRRRLLVVLGRVLAALAALAALATCVWLIVSRA